MHKEILTKEQIELLPVVKKFSKNFGLVGGTAIAFHIGHRESIDFDLFSMQGFNNLSIKTKILTAAKIDDIIVNKLGEFTIIINGVKITFFHYPYKIEFEDDFSGIIKMPTLITLASMKAYALGMRAKWKDYVDLYFIMKDYYSINEITTKAKEIFKNEFNEKIFRAQLSYFNDVNYSEEIIYKKGFETSDKKIKEELIKISIS